MFARGLDGALIFSWDHDVRADIHTCFVRFPIDVLWLDDESRIVALREGLRPFRFAFNRIPSRYVIEMPAGTIARTGAMVGDEIAIEP